MYEKIKKIALEAGLIATQEMETLSASNINSKAHLDLVTHVDRSVEQFISERIGNLFPDDGIFGEEGSSQPSLSGRTWIIDPIDGTFNYVRKSNDWSISIGLVENGRPLFGVIYAPMRNELFVGGMDCPATLNGRLLPIRREFDRNTACVGVGFHPQVPQQERFRILGYLWDTCGVSVRLRGAATISLTEIAQGFTDGYIGVGESTWDVAAACAILPQVDVSTNLNWRDRDLTSKLKFAAGSKGLLELINPLIESWH